MSSKDDGKPGFFKRLFGGGSSKKSSSEKSSTKRSDGSTSSSSSRHASSSDPSSPTKPKPSHSPLLAPPVKTRTPSSGSSGGGGRSPTTGGDIGLQPPAPERKPRRPKPKGQKHRKRTKAMIDPGAIKVQLFHTFALSFFIQATPHYAFCQSVRLSVLLSVCLVRARNLTEGSNKP